MFQINQNSGISSGAIAFFAVCSVMATTIWAVVAWHGLEIASLVLLSIFGK